MYWTRYRTDSVTGYLAFSHNSNIDNFATGILGYHAKFTGSEHCP